MAEQVNTLNIPSIQSKKQITFKAVQPSMQGVNYVPASDAYVTSMQGNGQGITDTDIGNRAKNSVEFFESPYVLPLTLAVWYPMVQWMDKFGKACHGDYEKTILGKVTNAGDKLSNSITNSRFAQSGFGKAIGKVGGAIGGFVDRFTNNPKHKISYALRNTHSRPEISLVANSAAGISGYTATDTKTLLNIFTQPIKHAAQLEQYGKDKTYINNFIENAKRNGWGRLEFREALQREELAYFGVKPADIVGKSPKELADMLKELKITKGLGFKNAVEYNTFMDDRHAIENIKELRDILKRGDQNLKIVQTKKDGLFGKIQTRLFGRSATLSELANKIDCITTAGKTKLGRFSGKSFGYLVEGCTNRFAGGKFMPLAQAGIFAGILYYTFQAPSGEKGKTFVERFVNDFTYFLSFPLSIGLMHMVGGLKYLGLSKDKVAQYRSNLVAFNFEAHERMFANKKEYKLAKKALDKELNAGMSIFNPLRWVKKAAKLLTIGLERPEYYRSHNKLNLNWLRATKHFGRGVLGCALRFILPMVFISPKIANFTTECAHKIFGRPTNSVLDEGKDEEDLPEQTKPQPVITQQNDTRVAYDPSKLSDTNLIKMRLNGQPSSQITQTTVINNVNKPENTEPQGTPEPIRTYIPSPEGVLVSAPDTSAIDAAMARAEAVEKEGYDILKSI